MRLNISLEQRSTYNNNRVKYSFLLASCILASCYVYENGYQSRESHFKYSSSIAVRMTTVQSIRGIWFYLNSTSLRDLRFRSGCSGMGIGDHVQNKLSSWKWNGESGAKIALLPQKWCSLVSTFLHSIPERQFRVCHFLKERQTLWNCFKGAIIDASASACVPYRLL